MAKLFPMFSGSSGNCTYVGGAQGAVLIDAGHSATSILKKMEAHGMKKDNIQGVLITHEHSDHIKGLPLLIKRTGWKVFASDGTAAALREYLPEAEIEIIEKSADLGGISVERFNTPHDCLGSSGYKITLADGLKFAVCTDLGHVTDEIRQAIYGCDGVLIESNHDVMMLQNGPYPFELKCRISGENGHLSNAACAIELPNLIKSGATRIILGHISRENNTPDIALATARAALFDTGLREDYDYILRAAAPDGDEVFYISR